MSQVIFPQLDRKEGFPHLRYTHNSKITLYSGLCRGKTQKLACTFLHLTSSLEKILIAAERLFQCHVALVSLLLRGEVLCNQDEEDISFFKLPPHCLDKYIFNAMNNIPALVTETRQQQSNLLPWSDLEGIVTSKLCAETTPDSEITT